MTNSKVDQLAATLKSAGLAASVYDAKNMAQSITSGVEVRQQEVEHRIEQSMGTGVRDEQPHPLFQPANQQPAKPKIENLPKEEKSFMQEKMECAEVFVNQDSMDGELDQSKPLSQVMEPEQIIEAVEPKIETQTELEAPEDSSESDSLSIFEEPKVEPAAQESAPVETMQEETPEVQLEPEVPLQEPIAQESAPVEIEEAPQQPQVAEPAPQPEQQQQTPKPAAPERKLVRTDTLYELEIDKSQPRAELTEEEKESTDITKFFNFANR